MDGYWRRYTKLGALSIRRIDGAWHVLMNGESLGAYDTPQRAHEALLLGKLSACDVKLSTLELPKQLADWQFYPRHALDTVRPASGPFRTDGPVPEAGTNSKTVAP
jgi:hypothetical protein